MPRSSHLLLRRDATIVNNPLPASDTREIFVGIYATFGFEKDLDDRIFPLLGDSSRESTGQYRGDRVQVFRPESRLALVLLVRLVLNYSHRLVQGLSLIHI